MTLRVYADESKARSYLLVAASARLGDLRRLRKELDVFRLPGQRSLHMKNERVSRRRALADLVAKMPITASVYDAGTRHRSEKEARRACLAELLLDIATESTRLVLHLDETLLRWDRQQLIELRRTSTPKLSSYVHETMAAEPLLTLPDVIAWCWAKGGDWRRRVEPVVVKVKDV